MKARIMVLTGYGINCDEETEFAFNKAGGKAERIHINDLIENAKRLRDYQILAFPGGFSYGDDTGAGNAFANKFRDNLWDELIGFVDKQKLVIGICNGFQVMVNLGLFPVLDGDYGVRQEALVHNNSARYIDRWVDLEFEGHGPWIDGIERISIPIAHGEGKFYGERKILGELERRNLIAVKYVKGEVCKYQNLEANPNGSFEDIAGITNYTGRVIGMMPHPERAIFFTQHPKWPLLKEIYKREGKEIPQDGDGMRIFENGVGYFE